MILKIALLPSKTVVMRTATAMEPITRVKKRPQTGDTKELPKFLTHRNPSSLFTLGPFYRHRFIVTIEFRTEERSHNKNTGIYEGTHHDDTLVPQPNQPSPL